MRPPRALSGDVPTPGILWILPVPGESLSLSLFLSRVRGFLRIFRRGGGDSLHYRLFAADGFRRPSNPVSENGNRFRRPETNKSLPSKSGQLVATCTNAFETGPPMCRAAKRTR